MVPSGFLREEEESELAQLDNHAQRGRHGVLFFTRPSHPNHQQALGLFTLRMVWKARKSGGRTGLNDLEARRFVSEQSQNHCNMLSRSKSGSPIVFQSRSPERESLTRLRGGWFAAFY
jgi:hypothetical protein